MNVMSMPISKIVVLAAAVITLSACSNNSEGGLEAADEQARLQAEKAGNIECALAGKADFSRVCTTERIAGSGGQILVIRHPDGGFRRFNILTDGRGLAPSQGADLTRISILSDGQIELISADDRYRLPAKIKGEQAEAAKPPVQDNAELKDAG
jgi:hypothetical protein